MTHTDSESKTKDDVYRDRNLLALAFIRFYSRTLEHVGINVPMGAWPDTDDVNGESWAVVWVNTTKGQVGWHVPLDMCPQWLPTRNPDYDGYTTEEKNERMEWVIHD